jgi:hypothetical protein
MSTEVDMLSCDKKLVLPLKEEPAASRDTAVVATHSSGLGEKACDSDVRRVAENADRVNPHRSCTFAASRLNTQR